MESYEFAAMIVVLLLMFGTIGAKIGTTQLIARMQKQIAEVGGVKQQVLNRLKVAQSQKDLAVKNKEMLEAKHAKLEKRLKRMKKDISSLEYESDERKKRQESQQDLRQVD